MPSKKSKSDSMTPIILLGVVCLVIVAGVLIASLMNRDNFKVPSKVSKVQKKKIMNPKLAMLAKPKKPQMKPRDLSKLPEANLNLSADELRAFYKDAAKRRLDLERPAWIDYEPIIQHKDEAAWLAIDGDWTNNAGWMSQIRNRVVICGNTRTKMKITTLGPDFSEQINQPQATVSLPNGHTRFGQGCEYRWTDSEGEERMIYIVPITRSGGGVSLGLYSIQNTLVFHGALLLSDVDIFHAGWVTQDPISKNIFVQFNTSDRVSSSAEYISIYSLRSTGGFNMEVESLATARVRGFIRKCTGGFFSRNGIMYMANNDDDNSGFSAYKFGYDEGLESYSFQPLRSYRVRKPSESIFGGDSQDIVGFTSLYGMFNVQPNLFGILHKNEDIGDDNLSWTSVEGLM